MAATQSTHTSPPIRCGYVNVFEPRDNPFNDKLEYSLQMIIPRDSEFARELEAAVEAVLAKTFKGKKVPAKANNPLVDAEEYHEEKGRPCPDYLKGCYQVNVKNVRQPGVVDRNMAEVIDPREFQSGDYARVNFNLYGYAKGDGGASCSLQNVQVIRKGEPLGSSSRPEDAFEKWGDEEEEDVFA